MPWTLVAVLIISLPLAGINYFVGRMIFRALVGLFSWNRSRLKLWMIGIHAFLNLLPVVFLFAYLIAGRGVAAAFSGDNYLIDFFLSYPFWISLVIMIQLLALFILLEFLDFSILRFVRPLRERWHRWKPLAVIGLSAFVALYSVIVIVRDTWSVRIVRHEIALPKDLECLRGFRIAEISDVQGDGRTTYDDVRQYVAKVNSLSPDVVGCSTISLDV